YSSVPTDEKVFPPADTLNDLLQDQEIAFIERSYRTLLKRSADRQGLEYYLMRLRNGSPKMQILLEMSRSSEAQRVGVKLPGLEEALRRYQRARAPLFGPIVSLFSTVEK